VIDPNQDGKKKAEGRFTIIDLKKLFGEEVPRGNNEESMKQFIINRMNAHVLSKVY